MKVTLRDIAARTGVSVNTVSHALAGKPDISRATREEIERVAAELGYIRNNTAGALRSGHSGTIAAILPDMANPHFVMMLRGIEAFFRERHYTVFVLNTDENVTVEADAIRAVLGQNVDGIILCPVAGDTENLRYLSRAGVPFVLLGRHSEEVKTDFVVCDDEEGGYLSARCLLAAGHRHIAFFNGDRRISTAREREAGIRRAFAEADVPLPPSRILTLSPRTGGNRDTVREFFAREREVTGLIAFSDLLAYEVISVLAETGREVPRDLSVVGFDNICADFLLPMPLSSVSVAKKTMTATAAQLLWERIEGIEPKSTAIVLPTALIERATVKKLL